MPLTREQFKTTLQILTPHFGGTEADRQGIVRAALHPSPVLDSVTWSGGADIFTPNLITRLGVHDDTISLIALLQHVRSPVGDSHQTAITTLIDELSAAAAGTPAFVFVSTPENQGRPVRRLIDDLTRFGGRTLDRSGWFCARDTTLVPLCGRRDQKIASRCLGCPTLHAELRAGSD